MSCTTSADAPSACPRQDFDAYALPPEAVQIPPSRLGRSLRQIGPGLILAGAIVGTGELIATTHLGAKVGFTLLWLIVLSCFIKVFVQAELGSNAIATGKTTLAAFREIPRFGGLIGWWWLAMMLLTHLQLAAIVGGLGQALHMAMPWVSPMLADWLSAIDSATAAAMAAQPGLPWSVLCAVGTSVVLALGGYGIVEKGSAYLVAAFTFVTVGCVVLLPSAGHAIPWTNVFDGLKFHLPLSPDALMAAFAVLGITGVGATELVAYPYWCIEKGYARRTGRCDGTAAWLSRAQGWVRVMKLDAWCSMAIYTTATLAFYFLGAATLHGRSPSGLPRTVDAMLTTLSQMYTPVMGPRLATGFIIVGVFAVLYSTLYSAVAGHARTVADFAHTYCNVAFSTSNRRQRWVVSFCVAFPLIDLALFSIFKDPVRMVLVGGFVQGLTLPMIAAAALYLRYRRTDPRITRTPLWDVFLWISFACLCVASAFMFWDTLRRLPF